MPFGTCCFFGQKISEPPSSFHWAIRSLLSRVGITWSSSTALRHRFSVFTRSTFSTRMFGDIESGDQTAQRGEGILKRREKKALVTARTSDGQSQFHARWLT